MLPWAQRRLRELLGGADVVAPSSSSPSSSTFKTGPEVETSGEAVVNSRKGKLIPAYELTIKGTWKEEGDEDKRGDWEIYLADENQGDDPEIKTSVAPGAGEAAEESARRFRDAAKVGIVPKLRDFVKELAAGGGPGGGGSDGASAGGAAAEGKAAPANKSEPAAAAAAVAAAPKPAAPAPKPAAAPSSSKEATTATTTLMLTEKFYCRPSDLFEALTDPRKVMAFTQAPAEIEGPPFRVGNKYSIFAGAVEAKFAEGTDAERHRIELDWRFKEVRGKPALFVSERRGKRGERNKARGRERAQGRRKRRTSSQKPSSSSTPTTTKNDKTTPKTNSGPTPPCPASPSGCASPPRGSPS